MRARPDAVIDQLTSLPAQPDKIQERPARRRALENRRRRQFVSHGRAVRRPALFAAIERILSARRRRPGRRIGADGDHCKRQHRHQRAHVRRSRSARLERDENGDGRAPLRILLWARHLVSARRRLQRRLCAKVSFRSSATGKAFGHSSTWKMPLERPSARSRPSRASTTSSMTIRLPLPIGFRDLRSGSAALIRRM